MPKNEDKRSQAVDHATVKHVCAGEHNAGNTKAKARLLCEHRTYHFALTTDLLMPDMVESGRRCKVCAALECWSQTVLSPGFRKMERATKEANTVEREYKFTFGTLLECA